MHSSLLAQLALLLLLLLISSCNLSAGAEQELPPLPTAAPKPGRYLHELHGANSWYTPDYSGKYRHEPRPYDGGYGDRGEPYANDLRGIFRQAEAQLAASVQAAEENFSLGPRDHLRFMIDFNYNGTGWQIIQFEWLRDGDGSNEAEQMYNYVNENRLWETTQQQPQQHAYEYAKPTAATAVDCEPEQHGHYELEEQQLRAEKDPMKVQQTLNEVLEYIQQSILPTLN
ncbi:CG13155 [Drosophila busckii]|uniref:CG13155 n=1 Tax=Drosophila busckii TaxID=30019 RepID=A0A0M4E5L4_DROBS|nr:uncharacterized protein LOC108595835 [Drosophila busckii]ALC41591.1 CG13155 [Drosophila busckii]